LAAVTISVSRDRRASFIFDTSYFRSAQEKEETESLARSPPPPPQQQQQQQQQSPSSSLPQTRSNKANVRDERLSTCDLAAAARWRKTRTC
jgi:hypothetical protein